MYLIRGGTRSFFCTRATVCLAFCFFGPAVVRFFRAVPKPSRQFRSAPSIAHQRPTCQLRHNADPPPGSTSGKEWNALVRLSKIGPCYRMRAWFARAIALPDFWNRRSRGRSLSDRVARADDGGGVRLSLGNEPLPLTLFAITPPALTTATQPPGTAIVAAIIVASVRRKWRRRHHFSTAPLPSRRRRRGPPFSSSTARSHYPTRPDECNGLVNATIIIGEQRASINRDGKLELIEYLMIFLYFYRQHTHHNPLCLRHLPSPISVIHQRNINIIILIDNQL